MQTTSLFMPETDMSPEGSTWDHLENFLNKKMETIELDPSDPMLDTVNFEDYEIFKEDSENVNDSKSPTWSPTPIPEIFAVTHDNSLESFVDEILNNLEDKFSNPSTLWLVFGFVFVICAIIKNKTKIEQVSNGLNSNQLENAITNRSSDVESQNQLLGEPVNSPGRESTSGFVLKSESPVPDLPPPSYESSQSCLHKKPRQNRSKKVYDYM